MMIRCVFCEHEMKEISSFESDMDDGCISTEYQCPNCGAIEITYSCPESLKKEYEYYSEDHSLDEEYIDSATYDWCCPKCGNKLCWDSDFMRSEILGDVNEDDEEDDSIVHSYSCPHCGMSFEFVEAKPSEYKDYPYYKKREKIGKNDNNS